MHFQRTVQASEDISINLCNAPRNLRKLRNLHNFAQVAQIAQLAQFYTSWASCAFCTILRKLRKLRKLRELHNFAQVAQFYTSWASCAFCAKLQHGLNVSGQCFFLLLKTRLATTTATRPTLETVTPPLRTTLSW
jgi:hypothetical protein